MNQKVDHNRVRAMYKTGINKTNIAKRLRCSRKQVTRILSGYQDVDGDKYVNSILGTEHEHQLWYRYYVWLGSYNRVAYRFGVSRQYVTVILDQMRVMA